MIANTMMPSSTATAKKSCRKPRASHRPDQRNVEFGVEQHAVGLEVHRGQDEEAPHGEEVGDTGQGPLQQPGLTEDLFELVEEALGDVVLAAALVADGLAGPDEVGEEQDALRGEPEHDDRGGQPQCEPDPLESAHDVPPFPSYSLVTPALLLAGN